jgi:hypothetical protein
MESQQINQANPATDQIMQSLIQEPFNSANTELASS